MPRIVSFSHTTAALVNGHKTMTTRDWKPEFAARFKAGDEILAYDKNPRNGGKPVARLRLTADVKLTDPATLTREDFQREGFGFLAAETMLLDVVKQTVGDTPLRRIPPTVAPAPEVGSDEEARQRREREDAAFLWRIFKGMPPRYVVRFELLELLPHAEQYLRPGVVPIELPAEVE